MIVNTITNIELKRERKRKDEAVYERKIGKEKAGNESPVEEEDDQSHRSLK